MGTDSVAQDQIKAFVDRILRMKAEAKAINADIREIYGEAKSDGFDKTVLGKLVSYVEKRNEDSNAVAENEAIFDLYLTAYYGVGTVVATHTHAPDVGEAQKAERRSPKPEDAGSIPATYASAGSSNGRTAEFDSANAGSTPAPASNLTTFTPKPLRPYCLNPGTRCGGQGKKHCWKCEQAHSDAAGAA